MKTIAFILSIISMVNMSGQTPLMDTVFVKCQVVDQGFDIDTLYIPSGRSSIQVLAGTTFLPYSDKMIGLLNRGLSPINLQIINECNEASKPSSNIEYPKFIATSRDSDTLVIDVTILANCCHNFLGEAEVIGNDTLNLVYTSYGNFCSCQCNFTLRYRFDTSMEHYYQELKYVTMNNSKMVGTIPKKGLLGPKR